MDITKKRKHNGTICNSNKRISLDSKLANEINWNNMISASNVINYMIDDPLLDWIKYYNITNINTKPNHTDTNINHNNSSSHTNFIMNEGLKFEQTIYSDLKDKYNTIQIAESYEARSVEKFNSTIQSMKKGIEIIYQGVLHDYENCLYGCPDLLVRIDRINDIFNKNLVAQDEIDKMNGTFCYVVVDIKHSTLSFSQNKTNESLLLNSNSIPRYKGQLAVYNRLLGSVQLFEPKCVFIIGKNNCIGTIDYTDYDKSYYIKLDQAIEWIHRMRKDGHKWKLLPRPSCSELYPNMKNITDTSYYKIKKELSNKINEITSIWQCGYKKRVTAHNNRIYSWKNKKCTSVNMGFNPSKTSTTLDNILNINRQNKININMRNINEKPVILDDTMIEFYIDYETINNNIGQLTIDSTSDYIFMIGVGWEENTKWCFKNFILESMDSASEIVMMENFWNFINGMIRDREVEYSNVRFIHWTQAEPTFYKKFLEKNNNFPQLNFYDLHNYFLSNNIVVKDAFNFSLKTIANAMYKNKLIETCWNSDSECSNGLDAMFLAYSLYTERNRIASNPIASNPTMISISNYNMIDCKVMWEILRYIRKLI